MTHTRILAIALLAGALAPGQSLTPDKPSAGPVLAEVNGESIRESEIEEAIRPQLGALREQEKKLREMVLLRLIDNVLVLQAAKKEGLSVDNYIQRKVENAAVTEQEVEREFSRNRSKFTGALDIEAKYRIRRGMEDAKRAEAFRALTERLRGQAAIKNSMNQIDARTLEQLTKSGPLRGAPGAPILVVEFSDFQCPFCRSANQQLSSLVARHPDRVKLLVKHFPLDNHKFAKGAARAAACAEVNHERYWQFHDALFDKDADLSMAGLTRLAVSHGYERDRFAQCLSSRETDARVEAEVNAAKLIGVDRTPYFLIGDRRLFSVEEVVKAVQD